MLRAPLQALPGPFTLLDGRGAPRLQPARCHRLAGRYGEARSVHQPEQQQEVGEQLPVEDQLEVELDVGRSGERPGVAQQPQLLPVGDERPQVRVGAVEQLLNDRLGGAGGRTDDTLGAAIEIRAPTEQVDRHVLPRVADRECLVVHREPTRGGGGQDAEVQRAEQGQQPALPGEPGQRPPLGLGLLPLASEGPPRAAQVVEGTRCGLADGLVRREPVGRRLPAGQRRVVEDAGEQVAGQQATGGAQRGERRPAHAATTGR